MQWHSQRGVWGVQTPSIEKGVDFLLLKLNKSKIVATRCRILRLKCTKFRFRLGRRLGLRPRPLWGSSQRSLDPYLDLRGPTCKGRGGSRKQKGRGGDKEETGG